MYVIFTCSICAHYTRKHACPTSVRVICSYNNYRDAKIHFDDVSKLIGH